jgi:DeoR family fructose operon transcriptional repressor
MFASERIRMIKNILSDKRYIDVAALSATLNVSEVTIRRDLEKLESDGFLVRTYGGAFLKESSEEPDQPAEADSDNSSAAVWAELAEIANKLIVDGDVILLSQGLANQAIAHKIQSRRNITIMTNDLNIAAEFANSQGIKVIMPGGDLDLSQMCLTGKLTEEYIARFNVDKVFIEIQGASLQRGYTVKNTDQASLIKEMMNIATEKIIICQQNVFNTNSFMQVGPLSVANKVITQPQIPEAFKAYYFTHNIQLFTALGVVDAFSE